MAIIDVVVKRQDAVPYKHEDIVDPLIGNDECAISRGRAVLDEKGTGAQVVRYATVFRSGLKLGQIVQVQDGVLGLTYKGKVVGIQHQINDLSSAGSGNLTITTFLDIERPTTFYSLA